MSFTREHDGQLNYRVSYGILEEIPGEFSEFVRMPGVFLASPARELIVERRAVVGRKRFELWEDEGGRTMGRWAWERCV